MTRRLRFLMLFEAATFSAAAAIHFGALVGGYGHRKAGIAETVIAVALLVGAAVAWLPSPRSRDAALAAQAFAGFGVCIGLFMIAVGVGPRTVPDVVYHLAILATLVAGLVLELRSTPASTPRLDVQRRSE